MILITVLSDTILAARGRLQPVVIPTKVVRCPYCVLGDEFRPMVAHPDGSFVCTKCGHVVRPDDLTRICPCRKCLDLNLQWVHVVAPFHVRGRK